jgi:anti-sigma factor RsiW
MTLRSSLVCTRTREQVSLQLDDELSQLERRMLVAHLARCAECRAFSDDLTAVTEKLRYAPFEKLERPIVIRAPRRISAIRLQTGIAAALAFAALGIGTHVASSGPSSDLSAYPTVTRFPTQAELERELAIFEKLPDRVRPTVGVGTVL